MANNSSREKIPFDANMLLWDAEHLEESLQKLYTFTMSKGQESIDWYGVRSRPKKRWAQILRVVAILATSMGGIVPILSQIPTWATENMNPAWASVAIAVAATALGLDRFFGFSSAWMRFITSQLKLEARQEMFQFEWLETRASWQGQPPTYEQARAMVNRCAQFAAEVSTIVEQETLQWVSEFRNVLTGLDTGGRAQPARDTVSVESAPPR
ncbi:MAG: hypothetical protein FOGNACKC_05184 [Anaerolineae bacterium]|nr:hypothetical protein [Anaerolineae bacterium]